MKLSAQMTQVLESVRDAAKHGRPALFADKHRRTLHALSSRGLIDLEIRERRHSYQPYGFCGRARGISEEQYSYYEFYATPGTGKVVSIDRFGGRKERMANG